MGVSSGPGDAEGLVGWGRRRQRLSDTETEERMLQTAVAALVEEGVTVSLEHLRLEDVIRQAGVSRTAVYRRWPRKELFLGDVVLELARVSDHVAESSARVATEVIRRAVLRRQDWLSSARGRRWLAIDLVRELAWEDFREDATRSQKWQLYLALTVTSLSLPEGALREQVRHAMQKSEEGLTEWVAHSYGVVADLMGLRLKPGVAASFDVVADLGVAMMRGLILKELNAPDTAGRTVSGEMFGSDDDWTLPGLGFASVVDSLLEVDPEVEWGPERVEAVLERLRSSVDLFSRQDTADNDD